MLFIGVFVGSTDGEIKKFAETYRITFPVGKENGIAEALGVKGIPTTVFIARDGRIVKKYVGTIDSADLVSDIEAMLR